MAELKQSNMAPGAIKQNQKDFNWSVYSSNFKEASQQDELQDNREENRGDLYRVSQMETIPAPDINDISVKEEKVQDQIVESNPIPAQL